jgi:hypothetical protein
VDAALWTLAGVGAAGSLGLAKDWLIENRRRTLQWKKERDGEVRAARVASMLIADELDTHAMNYRQLAELGRTPVRPMPPNFLSSSEWDAQKHDLARMTFIPTETWTGLTHAYHNAVQVRARVETDGPNVTFPPARIITLNDHAEAAQELSAILSDAANTITKQMQNQARKVRRA